MNQRKFFRWNPVLIFLIVSLVLTISCNDDPSEFGIDLLPGEDKLELTSIIDSNIIAFSEGPVKINTRNKLYGSIGYYRDSELFGLSTAGFFINYKVPDTSLIADILEFKGAALFLNVTDYVGLDTIPFNIEVYKVEQFPDEAAGSDIDPYNYINSEIFATRKVDSIGVYLNKGTDQYISIELDSLFFLNLISKDNSFYLKQENFDSVFNGFYIKSTIQDDKGIINKINLSQSVISIEYLSKDSTLTEFPIVRKNSLGIVTNEFDDLFKQLDNNQADNDTVLYIQGNSGVKTKIKLPDLSFLKDSMPLSLNVARIEIPASYFSNNDSSIGLVLVDEYIDSIPSRIIDYENFASSVFNKEKNKFYLYFTQYLSQYLMDADSAKLAEGLYIIPQIDKELFSPLGVVMQNTENDPIKISILYNKLQ